MTARVDAKLRERLREARLTAGLTQVELAKALGEPQSFVSKYETGERRLSYAEVMSVCRALELDFVELARELQES